tara:strand:+ start:1409 stop:1540 length:132 start_codon:yes stop_codon:yes gene_type:complete
MELKKMKKNATVEMFGETVMKSDVEGVFQKLNLPDPAKVFGEN